MVTLLILIPVIALLVLDYFVAEEYQSIASRKGYCGRKYFWWSFFLGFVGYLMVAALPERRGPWPEEKTTECPQQPAIPCRNDYR